MITIRSYTNAIFSRLSKVSQIAVLEIENKEEELCRLGQCPDKLLLQGPRISSNDPGPIQCTKCGSRYTVACDEFHSHSRECLHRISTGSEASAKILEESR